MHEYWMPANGMDPRYEVSNLGRFRSFVVQGKPFRSTEPRYLDGATTVHGYTQIFAPRNGKLKHAIKLHRLILETFVGQCPRGHQTRHLNGDRKDNRLVNLTWGTSAENHSDRIRHGTTAKGHKNPKAKLCEDDVRKIRLRLRSGESLTSIAGDFGVTYGAISHIKTGRTWSHVPT